MRVIDVVHSASFANTDRDEWALCSCLCLSASGGWTTNSGSTSCILPGTTLGRIFRDVNTRDTYILYLLQRISNFQPDLADNGKKTPGDAPMEKSPHIFPS